MGPTEPSPFGEVPVSWTNLKAFAECTEAISETWEFQVVWEMSREYMANRSLGKNVLTIPPVDRGKPLPLGDDEEEPDQ